MGYYARRAAGEVGLILPEGTLTRRKGAADDANVLGEQALVGWKKVIDAVHQAGGKMGPQQGAQLITAAEQRFRAQGVANIEAMTSA